MKSMILFKLLFILILSALSGCRLISNSSDDISYRKITAEEAKDMIDKDNSIIILDVRTEQEYKSGYIEGAIHLPENEILDEAEKIITDKSTTILLYCRSGRRSALAADNLIELGFSNVYDFGGIIDWKYDIVTN
ncbi:MAG: rhodanese-like domain-containing protein [Clostridiales bacterium]|jgi:rhodanese-related sulfurtransferase|nr:rhodanese-like domain-containing protein [Clostridiales bacterium]